MPLLQSDAARRVETTVAAALSLALVALHVLAAMHAGPLWRDEISSLSLATAPSFEQLWSRLLYDPFPILFFAVLRLWHATFGDADLALRMLGLAIGCAGVAAFWVAARLTGRHTPIVALALLGFSPVLIVWGDRLRGYGLAVALIVVVFGCLWRLAERASTGRFLLAATAAVLSVQSGFTNALLVFACGAAAIAVTARRRAWRGALAIMAAGAVAAISLLPYLPTVLATREWSTLRAADGGVAHYLAVLGEALMGWDRLSLGLWLAIAPAAILAGLLVAARSQARDTADQRCELAAYASISAVIGLVATIAFFRIVSWPTNIWYYLPLLALVAISVDTVVDALLPASGARMARTVAAASCIVVATPMFLERLETRASNIDLIARTIEAREKPGDLVVIQTFADAITFGRYYRGASPWTPAPPMNDRSLHRWDEVIDHMRAPDAMKPLLARIRTTLRGGHRVWLVTNTGWWEVKREPPRPEPFDPSQPRRLDYYLFTWSRQLFYELRAGAAGVEAVEVAAREPISRYENDALFLVSGAAAP